MVPVLIALAGHGLTILQTKIQQFYYDKEQLKIQQKQQLLQAQIQKEGAIHRTAEEISLAKQLMLEKELHLSALKSEKVEKEQVKTQKEQTRQKLEQALLAAREREDFDEEQRLTLELAETEKELLDLSEEIGKSEEKIASAEKEVNNARAQYHSTLEDEANYLEVSNRLQEAQNNSASGLLGILSKIKGVETVLNLLGKAKNAISKEALLNKQKELALEAKQLKNAGKNLQAKILEGLAGIIPKAPWFIGIAIAALVLGTIIYTLIKKSQDFEGSIENTRESLDKLQSELYNLNQSITTINKLSGEFDTLSSKVNKTAEDLERLNEIAQQVNDTLGYEAIDTNADYKIQALQIKGSSLGLENERKGMASKMTGQLFSGQLD